MECKVRSVKCGVWSEESATPATHNDMTTCLETSKRRDFAASPIDTATPQENQRLETRHVDAEKRAFRARLHPIFTVGNTTKGQVLQLPP